MNWIEIASIFAATLAVSFGAIGPALGEGRAVAAAMDAIARQPEAAGTISRTLFVGLATPPNSLDAVRTKIQGPQQVSFRNGRNERKMIASSSGREGLIARPDPSSKPAGTVNCGMMRRRQCRCGASNPSFAAVSIT